MTFTVDDGRYWCSWLCSCSSSRDNTVVQEAVGFLASEQLRIRELYLAIIGGARSAEAFLSSGNDKDAVVVARAPRARSPCRPGSHAADVFTTVVSIIVVFGVAVSTSVTAIVTTDDVRIAAFVALAQRHIHGLARASARTRVISVAARQCV